MPRDTNKMMRGALSGRSARKLSESRKKSSEKKPDATKKKASKLLALRSYLTRMKNG